MILADTSAWVEWLRGTGSPTALAMRHALESDEVATTDIVMLEVLAGSTEPGRVARWAGLLDAVTFLPQEPYADATEAARLFRACRRAGESPRQLTDCLVAAVAVRNKVAVLHRDRDFAVIARHTPLNVMSP